MLINPASTFEQISNKYTIHIAFVRQTCDTELVVTRRTKSH